MQQNPRRNLEIGLKIEKQKKRKTSTRGRGFGDFPEMKKNIECHCVERNADKVEV